MHNFRKILIIFINDSSDSNYDIVSQTTYGVCGTHGIKSFPNFLFNTLSLSIRCLFKVTLLFKLFRDSLSETFSKNFFLFYREFPALPGMCHQLVRMFSVINLVLSEEFHLSCCFRLPRQSLTIRTYIRDWLSQPFSKDYNLASHSTHVLCVNFMQGPPNNFFSGKCFKKKLLNIFSNFFFYLKVQSFRLIMENNFI